MSADLSNQLLSLYRASALDEPNPVLDRPILRAARRRRAGLTRPTLMVAVVGAFALTLVMTSVMTQGPPPPPTVRADVARLFLLQAGRAPPLGEQAGHENLGSKVQTPFDLREDP